MELRKYALGEGPRQAEDVLAAEKGGQELDHLLREGEEGDGGGGHGGDAVERQ